MKKEIIEIFPTEDSEAMMNDNHPLKFVLNPNPKINNITHKEFCEKFGHIPFKKDKKIIREFVNFDKWTGFYWVYNFKLTNINDQIWLQVRNGKNKVIQKEKLIWTTKELIKKIKSNPKFKNFNNNELGKFINLLQAKVEMVGDKIQVI